MGLGSSRYTKIKITPTAFMYSQTIHLRHPRIQTTCRDSNDSQCEQKMAGTILKIQFLKKFSVSQKFSKTKFFKIS